MTIRLKTESRACLLDSIQPGSLVHDVLAGAPVITRPGDPPDGLYEIDCSHTPSIVQTPARDRSGNPPSGSRVIAVRFLARRTASPHIFP